MIIKDLELFVPRVKIKETDINFYVWCNISGINKGGIFEITDKFFKTNNFEVPKFVLLYYSKADNMIVLKPIKNNSDIRALKLVKTYTSYRIVCASFVKRYGLENYFSKERYKLEICDINDMTNCIAIDLNHKKEKIKC